MFESSSLDGELTEELGNVNYTVKTKLLNTTFFLSTAEFSIYENIEIDVAERMVKFFEDTFSQLEIDIIS